jgi:hypothetical protein
MVDIRRLEGILPTLVPVPICRKMDGSEQDACLFFKIDSEVGFQVGSRIYRSFL